MNEQGNNHISSSHSVKLLTEDGDYCFMEGRGEYDKFCKNKRLQVPNNQQPTPREQGGTAIQCTTNQSCIAKCSQIPW